MIDVNLLPAEKIRRIRIEYFNAIATIASIIILVVAFSVAGSMALAKSSKQKELNQINSDVKTLEARVNLPENVKLRENAAFIQDRLSAIAMLKTDLAPISKLVEVLTKAFPENAIITKFDLTKEALSVEGSVGSYEELAQLIRTMEDVKVKIGEKELKPFDTFNYDKVNGVVNLPAGVRIQFKFNFKLSKEILEANSE